MHLQASRRASPALSQLSAHLAHKIPFPCCLPRWMPLAHVNAGLKLVPWATRPCNMQNSFFLCLCTAWWLLCWGFCVLNTMRRIRLWHMHVHCWSHVSILLYPSFVLNGASNLLSRSCFSNASRKCNSPNFIQGLGPGMMNRAAYIGPQYLSH